MSDRTEEEEERFIRQHARRLKVSPRRLLDALRPHGFFLASADRRHGINQIDAYLESTDARCPCERLWRYLGHSFASNTSELAVAVRCGASHDGKLAINLAALHHGR